MWTFIGDDPTRPEGKPRSDTSRSAPCHFSPMSNSDLIRDVHHISRTRPLQVDCVLQNLFIISGPTTCESRNQTEPKDKTHGASEYDMQSDELPSDRRVSCSYLHLVFI